MAAKNSYLQTLIDVSSCWTTFFALVSAFSSVGIGEVSRNSVIVVTV